MKTIRTYAIADHKNEIAYTSISRKDFEKHMATYYPTYYVPRGNGLEGQHEDVEVVFMDEIDKARYVLEGADYHMVATFFAGEVA